MLVGVSFVLSEDYFSHEVLCGFLVWILNGGVDDMRSHMSE